MTNEKKQKIELTAICPECGSIHLNKDNYRAELVCDNCGLVIEEDFIDYGTEWRAFDSDQREKRSRVGAPIHTKI